MNILLGEVQDEWRGYKVNTDFRTGIRIVQAMEDEDLISEERWQIIVLLLFQNEDGTVRSHPEPEEFPDLLRWLMAGWNHDNTPRTEKKQKLIDYDIDQWRIFADFIHVYGIDLSKAKMHFWAFQGLLWAMPKEHSSFLQVIEIRTKKPGKKAGREEREAIARAKEIYGLRQPEEPKNYTQAEIDKIEAFDNLRRKNK